MRRALFLFCVLLATACGGGGGGKGSDSGTQGGAGAGAGAGGSGGGGDGLTPNPGPQIALLMANGHSFGAAANYLAALTGPQLEGALLGAGYTVETSYFTDDHGGGSPGGYAELVAKLQQVRDEWINGRSGPTRIVIVAHSHGCVRAHAAIRAVPDCPVRLLVDLDGSSAGWSLTHAADNAAMGGAPEGAYAINATITCPAFPAVTSAPPPFDLEDVVFDSVQEAYEVRSGDVLPNPANPFQFIEYDERWNARPDGSVTGLTCHFSGTPHAEVAAPGVTLTLVEAWILTRLASD